MNTSDNTVTSRLLRGHFAQYQAVHCLYHPKEDNFNVKYYPKENLFIVECKLCRPANELCRVKVAPAT